MSTSEKIDENSGPHKFSLPIHTNSDVRYHIQTVMQSHTSLERPKVVKFIAGIYIFAVITIVLLSLTGQLIVHFSVSTSYRDARLVNFSGRQRMLSQMLVKDTFAIILGLTNKENITYFEKELRERIDVFYYSHNGLINGNKTLGLKKTKSKEILKKFDSIQSQFETIYYTSKDVLNILSSIKSSTNDSYFKTLEEYKDKLVSSEGDYWLIMNNIASMYQTLAEQHLKKVNIISWVLHALVVLTLVLEGLFLIRPILIQMQTLINERFSFLRRSLEAEAESSGVSVLMMGYLSHELEHPMQNLKMLLQNAIYGLRTYEFDADSGISTAEALQPTLHNIVDSIDRAKLTHEFMHTIIGDIDSLCHSSFSEMTLTIEFVDITTIVRQSTRALSYLVEPNVKLQVDVHSQLVQEKYQLDKQRVQQVVTNLVLNALRTTKKGFVDVRVGPAKRKSGWLRFEVLDSGPGLTSKQKALVFEPNFNRSVSSSSYDTSGLSLYIAKMLVGLQNGMIGVESKIGKGSTFWFEIPAAKIKNSDNQEINYSKQGSDLTRYSEASSLNGGTRWEPFSEQFNNPMFSPEPNL